jgi:hypothetical protein
VARDKTTIELPSLPDKKFTGRPTKGELNDPQAPQADYSARPFIFVGASLRDDYRKISTLSFS